MECLYISKSKSFFWNKNYINILTIVLKFMNPSLKNYLYDILLLEDVEVKASEARELDSYVLLESGEKTKKNGISGMIVVIVISSN